MQFYEIRIFFRKIFKIIGALGQSGSSIFFEKSYKDAGKNLMRVKSSDFMKHVLWITAKTIPKKNVVELSSLSLQFAIQIFPIYFVIGQKFLAVSQLVDKINIGKAVRLLCQGNTENVFVTRALFCSMANVSRKMIGVVSCRAV